MESGKLTALVFGGTGAIGHLLVKELVHDKRWGKIICVGRNALPEWTGMGDKLQIHKINMDELEQTGKWKFEGVDTVFCCLGSQTKHGKEAFIKTDKTYPLWIADIAKANGIKHYSLISSIGASSGSWFLYPRTKGEVEAQLKEKGLPLLSIFRPGVLKHRVGARFGQIIGSHIPFFPKIECVQLAQCLRLEAQKQIDNGYKDGPVQLYENSQILAMLPW